MSLEIGSRLGHYDVTALIGEAGMGQVYRGRDTKLDLRPTTRPCPSKLQGTSPNVLVSILVLVVSSLVGSIAWAQSARAGQSVSVNGMEMYYEIHTPALDLTRTPGIHQGSRKQQDRQR